MNHDSLIIREENTNSAICLTIDDHKTHLIGHLPYIWKPRVLRHMIQHLFLWRYAKKNGIPGISFEEVLSSVRGLKK